MLLRLLPDNPDINFMRLRVAGLVFSMLLVLGSLGLVFGKGLNFGIDFTGGLLIEVRVAPVPDLGELRRDLNALGLGEISIQEFGEPDDLLIRAPLADDSEESQRAAEDAIRSKLDAITDEIEYRRVEFVGPQVGKELIRAGLMAILLSLAGILVYVSFRFEWPFGVSALAALIHDSLLTVGFFAVTGQEFNLATVAAVLTIAGYSINDTVVVFDRVRENLRKFKKMPVTEVLNMSLSQTLTRTILTSVTTLLALIALWMFGGPVIQGFVNALIFGVIIGTYSTIFVAGSMLPYFKLRRAVASDQNDVALEA